MNPTPALRRSRLTTAVTACVVASSAVFVAACAAPPAARVEARVEVQVEVLRVSPFGPPEHLLNRQVMTAWAESVGQATQGRVRVELLAQPVAPPAAIRVAVQQGLADVSLMSNGALTDAPPLNALVEFAGQTPDAERASVAYQRIVQRYPALADEFLPLVLLGVFTHGPGAVLLAGPAPAAPDGLAALTLHAGGSGATTAVRALGAQVVTAPGPAARDLIEQGRVAGSMTPMDSYTGLGLTRHIKAAVTMPGGFYNAGLSLVVNRERWEALPAADRASITGVSGETFARAAGRAWDAGDARSREKMLAAGVVLTPAEPALVAGMLAARSRQERAWIDRRGVLAADAENALAEYRDELRGPEGTLITGSLPSQPLRDDRP